MSRPTLVYVFTRIRRSGTHCAAGKVHLASELDQPQDARLPASKAGLPARLVPALRVAVLCALGMVALAIAAAVLSGCERPAESVSGTTNSAFQVERLFTHDGCTVYRFEDANRPRYFVRCEDGTQRAEWDHVEGCGKGCSKTIPESADTVRGGGR